MTPLENIFQELVSEEALRNQLEKLRRAVPMADWEAGRKNPLARRRPLEAVVRRFWSSVVFSDDCWLHRYGIKPPHKHTRIALAGRQIGAHVLSWTLHHGPVPNDKEVCHRCYRGACVRPDHLYLDTHSGNIQDAADKGLMPKGETHHNAYMTRVLVIAMLEAMRDRNLNSAEAAREFGTSRSNVFNILYGKAWREITGIPKDRIGRSGFDLKGWLARPAPSGAS